jgi:hypothetical protein
LLRSSRGAKSHGSEACRQQAEPSSFYLPHEALSLFDVTKRAEVARSTKAEKVV